MLFTSKLRPDSIASYALWRLFGRSYPVNLRLANGPWLQLRPIKRGENDYGTAYEIFIHDYYNTDHIAIGRDDVKLIVDLGSNVGFSCLYWLNAFPRAKVVAFEPHPAFVGQLRKNLALNDWTRPVIVHPVAAGTRTGTVRLSDAGTSSSVQDGCSGGIEVSMEDFFAECAGESIDILKIDIEGGEYALLEDERFERLSVRYLIMEWHLAGESDRNGEWCHRRLQSMGYTTTSIFDSNTHGMLRASRDRT